MSRTISLKCNNCNNFISMTTGQDLKDNDLDRVLTHFDNVTVDRIQADITNAGPDAIWNYRRMIARCRNTREIRSIPTFHLIQNSTDNIIACACTCGGDHDFYEDEDILKGSVKCSCPKCGHDMRCYVVGYSD